MIFLKRFKKKVASVFTEHTDRTDIIIINRLCHGYNTDVSRIKNIPYKTFDLKYLKFGLSMLWIRLQYFSPHQVFIKYFNIMLPIGGIGSKGNPYLSRYFVLCMRADQILDKTEIQYRYKTKEIKCDLFGKSYKIEKTNITEFIIPCKIVINYIKN